MRNLNLQRPSRRRFLKTTSGMGAGLVLGFVVPGMGRMAFAQQQGQKGPANPNAFLRITPDSEVIVQVPRIEIGQGVQTSLPMMIAEELDCDWDKVRAELAPAADPYKDPIFGIQMVGGSASIANYFDHHRRVGAAARAMLVQAAAKQWNVDASACSTANGVIHGPGGRQGSYGEFASAAMTLPVPNDVKLKDPKTFKIIGKPTRRLDALAKSNGTQIFSIDVRVDGMVTAVVARPPTWGVKIASFDIADAQKQAGFIAAFKVPQPSGGEGLAVVADTFWHARRARDAVKVSWNDAGVEKVDSKRAFEQYRKLADTPGIVVVQGKPGGGSAARRIEAVYEFPYLAHVPMEPLNITLHYHDGRAEVWAGSQFQTIDQATIAQVLGIDVSKVDFKTVAAGGGFGRRAVATVPHIIEAAAIAKGVEGKPVKVMYTREDDVHAGFYRPMHVHKAALALDATGNIVSWDHTIVGQSITMGTPFESYTVKNGVDDTMVEGVHETQYNLPMLTLNAHTVKQNVPVLWWRSVGNSHTGFVMETLVDEAAAAAGQDPVAYRRKLLSHDDGKRSLAALELAVEKSGYTRRKLPNGHAFGVAVHRCFGTSVAYVAEVSMAGKRPKVHNVWAGVHCNRAVNPLTVEAQVQGGAVFGIGMTLPGFEITLADGVVQQNNFTDFRPAYGGDAPPVHVFIVPSEDPPTGMGEPPVPPIAPAIANAVAKLTGQRYRRLPFQESA
jgi:isoquinoline 1-oxidoreductase beta subunit